jgi:hypothetical protein
MTLKPLPGERSLDTMFQAVADLHECVDKNFADHAKRQVQIASALAKYRRRTDKRLAEIGERLGTGKPGRSVASLSMRSAGLLVIAAFAAVPGGLALLKGIESAGPSVLAALHALIHAG